MTDHGIAALLRLVLENGSMRELYLYDCYVLTTMGAAMMKLSKRKMHEQCKKGRPRSWILWSVFDDR